jgi:NodT family efflux transporter outer membrane factor (OMF) lipoprotein
MAKPPCNIRIGAEQRLILGMCALLTLLSCKVGPDYEAPVTPTPDRWVESAGPGTAARADLDTGAAVDLSRWWARLGDPELTSLVEQAIESNLEMRLAEARVREAIALRKGSFAELAPLVAIDADYVHRRAARNSSADGDSGGGLSGSVSQSASNLSGLGPPSANLRLGDNSATIRLPEAGSDQTVPEITVSRSRGFGGDSGGFQRDRNSYEALLGATWEVDIWGGIRRGVEAADAEIGASVEDRRAVMVAVSAEVARNYVLLRGLQRLTEVTEDNIAIQRETLESIQSRFAASLATGTDVLQAQIQLQRTEAELPPLQAAVKETIFRLSVLLGQPPGYLVDRLNEVRLLPEHPDLLTVGMPSELLRRRPDIRAAERRVAAETARIGVEVAELFPRVSLAGTFGLQSADADDIVDARSLTWSFGPSVRWRLVEFGRIISNITVQEERQRQALTLYRQSVLEALEQVETSLANYAAQRQRSETLAEVNAVNQRAFELAKSEYAVGMISFLSVLDTQGSLFATQTELIRARQQALVELVNLYESLGGGWPENTTRDEDRAAS